MAGAAAGDRVRRPRRVGRRRGGRRRRRDVTGRLHIGHHQRAGVRRRHQLCVAADLALSRRVGPQRVPSAGAGYRGATGRSGHHRQQCHRGAGAAHLAVRVVSEYPQPRRPGRLRAGGRGGVRPVGTAPAVGPVRSEVVLAVRPSRRRSSPHRQRGVAPGSRRGRQAARASRGGLHRRAGAAVHRPAQHTDRAVADRTVPRPGRIGQRIRHSGGALPQRSDRSHRRHRVHRPGGRSPARDRGHPRRRLGHPDGVGAERPEPVVGRPVRRPCLRRGVRHRRRAAGFGASSR